MSPSVITLASSDTIEESVFPLTNTNQHSHYRITCVNTIFPYMEHGDIGWPNLGRVVEVTYELSSNNFGYYNCSFSPPNPNGGRFLRSITSIDGVDAGVVTPSNKVIVLYSSAGDLVSAEPAVLRAIARGAMGLGIDWVRVMRQRVIDKSAPL